jgi:hypothetical protein
MSDIYISINTFKSVSTVQLEYGDDYVVENSDWTGDEAKFPFKAIYRGVKRLIKIRIKRAIPKLKNKLTNYFINR